MLGGGGGGGGGGCSGFRRSRSERLKSMQTYVVSNDHDVF